MSKAYFKILDIDHSKENITEALGVTKERFDIITPILAEAIENEKFCSASSIIEHVLEECESIAEVIFIFFTMGKHPRFHKCGKSSSRRGSEIDFMRIPLAMLPQDLMDLIEKYIRDIGQDDDN